MRPIYQNRQLVAADADGIAAAQQLLAAGNLVLNGALVAAGIAVLGQQRRVILDSAGNLSAVSFTIYGTNDGGVPISEVLVGPNAAPVQSVLDYATVTRIAASAAVGTDITAGTNGVGSSPPVILDQYGPSFNVMEAVILLSGAVNYTCQYTFDDVFNALPTIWTWWNNADLTAKAASAKGSLVNPVRAVRVLTNSGVGEIQHQVVQGALA